MKKIRYFSALHSLSSPLPPHLLLFPRTLISANKTLRPHSILHLHHFHVNPTSYYALYLIPCSGSVSVLGKIYTTKTRYPVRLFSASSSVDGDFASRPNSGSVRSSESLPSTRNADNSFELYEAPNKKEVARAIIEHIRSKQSDLEQKLSSISVTITVDSTREIFRGLSCEKLSALRFYFWIRNCRPSLCHNSDICSLIIDNCGWFGDHERMVSLLKEFSSNRVCLTEEAFQFLPVFSAIDQAAMEEPIQKLIEILNEVGGSCRGSGICALIKVLCIREVFDVAKFAIDITERKATYYNILIRESCRQCKFSEARDIIDEMRRLGCDPNAKTYNYLLSSLFKSDRIAEASSVLDEMKERFCFPDHLTFEILIYYSCRLGKINFALQCFDQMVLCGLQPRLSTHAAFIKSYVSSRQYQEAYNYVVNCSIKYSCSSNYVYSLLANLHRKEGNILVARNILISMMEKGLKPHFPVYINVLKHLCRMGRSSLATDLEVRFSMLRLKSSIDSI